jgi:Tol biopolymer transport system component
MAVLLGLGRGTGRTLARVPMGGGAPREVADHVLDASWAPDGSALAVILTDAGKNRIEFPIGTSLYEAVHLSNVRVSPQGDRVAYQALGHVWVCDLATSGPGQPASGPLKTAGAPHRLTKDAQHFEFMPSFSRDGKSIVYVAWGDDDLGSRPLAAPEGLRPAPSGAAARTRARGRSWRAT